jgi:hypothetical protein
MANEPKKTKTGGFFLFRIFRYPVVLMTLVCALTLGGAYIYSIFAADKAYAAAAPQPALEGWLSDLNGYHSRKYAYPPDLRDLEKEIWIPSRSGPNANVSQLQYGPRMYVKYGYAYLYQRDSDDASICSLWAVPQGERYKEGSTYFWLITPKTVNEWRGPALTVDQMKAIPPAARPTGEQMAQLGMTKQASVMHTTEDRGILAALRSFLKF